MSSRGKAIKCFWIWKTETGKVSVYSLTIVNEGVAVRQFRLNYKTTDDFTDFRTIEAIFPFFSLL